MMKDIRSVAQRAAITLTLVSMADLIGTEVKPSRAPAAAKYRHPENPSLTWSGRGRKPLWFVAALDAGKTPEDLAIS